MCDSDITKGEKRPEADSNNEKDVDRVCDTCLFRPAPPVSFRLGAECTDQLTGDSMTLSTRVWRQPVYRDRFLAAHTSFLLLNNRLSNSESMRAQVGHGLALQDQDSDEVVRRHVVEAGGVGSRMTDGCVTSSKRASDVWNVSVSMNKKKHCGPVV